MPKSNKRKAPEEAASSGGGQQQQQSTSLASGTNTNSNKRRRGNRRGAGGGRGRSGRSNSRTRKHKSSAASGAATTSSSTSSSASTGTYYGPSPTPDAVPALTSSADRHNGGVATSATTTTTALPSMPLLLRLLDVKPLVRHVGRLAGPHSSGTGGNDSSPTADMQGQVIAAGGGAASTSASASTSIVEATATDDTDTCRVFLPSSAITKNDTDGDGDDAMASYLVFVNGFYASTERQYVHHVPASQPRQPATIYLSDLEVLHTVRGEVERQRRREVAREQNGGSSNKKKKRTIKDRVAAAAPAAAKVKKEDGTQSKKDTSIRGGMAGFFFSKYVSNLSDEELGGMPTRSASTGVGHRSGASSAGNGAGVRMANAAEGTCHLDDFHDNKQKVDEMMARHSAMLTLLAAQDTSTIDETTAAAAGTAGTAGTTASRRQRSQSNGIEVAAAETYTSALREFRTSQLDRQNAGLTSNVGRADAAQASLLKQRHRSALDAALWHAENTREPLSLDLLCRWHATLCGGGLHSEAGRLRKKSVRAGRTTFTPPAQVRAELEKVIACLSRLEKRLVTERQHGNDGAGPLLFAATALFGIVDIHPFADGNGRLSRIVANWALRRSGLPFPVSLFVTPAQRREYVSAIEATRGATNLVYRGVEDEKEDMGSNQDGVTAASSARLDALRATGCFSSLVCLFADRISRAYAELRREETEKASRVSEEAEFRAARAAREKAAVSDCIICFSEKPNIATLCCGKAVHLNCIAEWLGSNESCPVCRQTMPKLETTKTKRPVRQQAPEEGNNFNIEDFDLATTEISDDAHDESPQLDTTDDTTEDFETANADVNDTTESNQEDDVNDTTESNQEDEVIDDTTEDYETANADVVDTTEINQEDDAIDDTTHDTTEDHEIADVNDTTESNQEDEAIDDTTEDYETANADVVDTTEINQEDDAIDDTTHDTTEDHEIADVNDTTESNQEDEAIDDTTEDYETANADVVDTTEINQEDDAIDDTTHDTTEDHEIADVNDTTESNQEDEAIDDTTEDYETANADVVDTTEINQEDDAIDDTTHDTTEDHEIADVNDTTESNQEDDAAGDTTEDFETTDDHHDTTELVQSDPDTSTTNASISADSGTDTTSADEGPEPSSNAAAAQPHRRCNCGNRSAIDCANGNCGRCCVLYGTFACSRHNV